MKESKRWQIFGLIIDSLMGFGCIFLLVVFITSGVQSFIRGKAKPKQDITRRPDIERLINNNDMNTNTISIHIIEMDGHEYIVLKSERGCSICHKADCKACKEVQ